ncbi:GDSL-type esterase/lipase family protein, partial [Actinosynnema sp. NPDC023658]|uniref:GDSL-type esterase/lipase family protein n=1 Tax=Actinosynnema sp. NPDC023658 TaxID=3155465 RepID=UPI00340C5C9D
FLTGTAPQTTQVAGVRLVLLSGADPSQRLPFGRTIHRRAEILTAAITRVAARHDVLLVDAFHDLEVRRAEYWSPDRLHLNAAGHQRVASLVLDALGHTTVAHAVDPAPAARRSLRAETRYYREHVLPWLNRRLRGISSGDDEVGKHPDWVEVEARPRV